MPQRINPGSRKHFKMPRILLAATLLAAFFVSTPAARSESGPSDSAMTPGSAMTPEAWSGYLEDFFRQAKGGSVEFSPTWKKGPAGFKLYSAHLAADEARFVDNTTIIVFPSGNYAIAGEIYQLPPDIADSKAATTPESAKAPAGTKSPAAKKAPAATKMSAATKTPAATEAPAATKSRDVAAPATIPAARLEAWKVQLKEWFKQDLTILVDDKTPPLEGTWSLALVEVFPGGTIANPAWMDEKGEFLMLGQRLDLRESAATNRMKAIALDRTPFRGSADAPLTAVQYSDFQCPSCKIRGQEIVEHLKKKYPGKFKFYYKSYPLWNNHPWALPAAQSTRCVYQQKPEAFWDLHDALYEAQATLTAESLDGFVDGVVKTLGLDVAKFGACRKGPTDAALLADITEARSLGFSSTPTFVIDGLVIDQDPSDSTIDSAVEHAMKMKGVK